MADNTITNQEFLLEKVKNFQKFVQSNIKNENLIKEMQQLENLTVGQLILFIMSEIKPNEKQLETYIAYLMKKYNVKLNDYPPETIHKFKKYLECFIDIVSQ